MQWTTERPEPQHVLRHVPVRSVVVAVLLIAATVILGYVVGAGRRGAAFPDRWIGSGKAEAYLFKWTQDGSKLSGTASADRPCHSRLAAPMYGTLSGSAITLHIRWAPGDDVTVVGTITPGLLELPTYPKLRPGAHLVRLRPPAGGCSA